MTSNSDPQQHNPYGVSNSPDDAKATKTQLLARMMLARREQGYTYSFFVQRNAGGYFKLLLAYGIPAIILLQLEQYGMARVLLGMLLGSYIRDVDWFRAFHATIPLSDAVTNWDKVQRIADGVETI